LGRQKIPFKKGRLKTVLLLLIVVGGTIIGSIGMPAVYFLFEIKIRVTLIKGLQVKSSALLVFWAGDKIFSPFLITQISI